MDSHDDDGIRGSLHRMHRDRPERRLAGVCAALADHLSLPLPVVRAGFLIGALLPSVNGLVIAAYLGLWFVTPPALGEPSGLERVLEAVRDLLGVSRERPRRDDDFSSDELPSDPSV
jgi:phage shock protein PspC (stress-responsive transcriptional regulator)